MTHILLFDVDGGTRASISSAIPAVEAGWVEVVDGLPLLLEKLRGAARPFDVVVIGVRAGDSSVAKRIADAVPATTLVLSGPDEGGHVRMALELVRLRARLAAADERHEGMMSLISHDIRAPIGVMSGALSELSHPTVGQLNEEQRTLVGLFRRGIDRLGALATNLSLLAKLDVGTLTLLRRRTDLVTWTLDQVRAFRPGDDCGNVEVKVEAPDAPLWCEVDPEKLAVVLANLLSNALRFAKRTVRVAIVQANDGGLSLEVDDDGHGIPERGGDVFERIPAAARRAGQSGSGLGLAVVRGVVAAHGGTARAENRRADDGKIAGARFVITLPT